LEILPEVSFLFFVLPVSLPALRRTTPP
jgi:hypothetical protein